MLEGMKKWEDFRIKREEAIKRYVFVKQSKMRGNQWAKLASSFIVIKKIYKRFIKIRDRELLNQRRRWVTFRVGFFFK